MASDQCSETTTATTVTKRVAKQNERPAPEILEQQQQQQLPCPRCDSTNTKFCYYNNYNFSQPRHFCKSCRRYWTHGGALRDIPVGGGSRKSAKRCRTSSSSSSSTLLTSCSSSNTSTTPTAVFVGPTQFCSTSGGSVGGGFTSLLSQGPGFLALAGGFGLGLGPGPGFEEMGACFGLGRGGLSWAFPAVEDGNNTALGVMVSGGGPGNSVGPAMGNIGNMWQLESGENGFVAGGGDCFAWPDLAISTPGNGLK